MSYDLFFTGEIAPGEILEYLENRGHVIGGAGASYHNENTGVYWSFAFGDDDNERPFAFNLNYLRPRSAYSHAPSCLARARPSLP